MRTRAVFAHAGISTGATLVLILLAGCSNSNDPFSYVKVSGKVTYEDGSVIPAKSMKVSFVSETPAAGNRYPRPGSALVDEKTGEFGCPMSAQPGLVRGKHKVLILGGSGGALPSSLVPPEYSDKDKTPLEVDTDAGTSITLKVRKPTGRPSTNPAASPAPWR